MTDATGGSPSDQPNHRPALSHFREWFADPSNRTKCFETRKRVKVETHEFISKSAIRTFFTPRCTQSILDELLSREVPVRQSLVRERCLIGFCILLSIGHGKYVGELSKHHDLRDGNLPFQGPPKHLPPNVWEEFMKAQWLFTPAEFRRGIDTHPKEMRLPYLDKEFIGEGVSARLYKVTVHHDYDVDLRGSVGKTTSILHKSSADHEQSNIPVTHLRARTECTHSKCTRGKTRGRTTTRRPATLSDCARSKTGTRVLLG